MGTNEHESEEAMPRRPLAYASARVRPRGHGGPGNAWWALWAFVLWAVIVGAVIGWVVLGFSGG